MTAPPTVNGIEDLVEVGSGSFGVVYRGWQPGARREVAVKVLTVPASAATARRLERECSALGAVSGHPNVVVVHDVWRTHDGRPCIVMEYLHGGSLADRMRVLGPLPPPEVVDVGVKLSSALSASHGAGVLHRDVKPENILVSRFGEPKLSDFGIASYPGAPAGDRPYVVGSFAHTAPEVLAGDQPSAVSDVYSLASTLFALLTGKSPHGVPEGDDIAGFLRAVKSAPVPDVRSHGVPEGLCRVLEQALARNPDDRQGSAEEFKRQLEQCTLAPSSASLTRPLHRRRNAALVLAGAAVAAMAFLTVGGDDRANQRGAGATTTISFPPRPTLPVTTMVRAERAERVVFQDDFSTPGRWIVSDDSRRTTAYADGQYRITAKPGSSNVGAAAPLTGPVTGGMRVEVDAVPVRGDEAQYGVSCVVQPVKGWYTGLIGSDGHWRIESGGFGREPGRVADGVDDALRLAAAQSSSRHISLECRFDEPRVTLRLSINGHPITTVATDELPESSLTSPPSLGVATGGQGAEILFDNFVVTAL